MFYYFDPGCAGGMLDKAFRLGKGGAAVNNQETRPFVVSCEDKEFKHDVLGKLRALYQENRLIVDVQYKSASQSKATPLVKISDRTSSITSQRFEVVFPTPFSLLEKCRVSNAQVFEERNSFMFYADRGITLGSQSIYGGRFFQMYACNLTSDF
jgi:hypothetical protein